MALVGWVDTVDVGKHWPDADVLIDPDALVDLLTVAHETCEAYAPALADGDAVPARYVMAQILQARAIAQMQRQGPGDTFGADGFSIAVYPLDARIRQMLRPKRPFGGLL